MGSGVNIINLKKTWEKLILAARAIAAIENPQDVYVVTTRPTTQRAVLKFARYVGCSSIAGRFTPGAFTNQIQAAFREPRLLLISDPRSDHQPVTEASYANIPIVAFTNVDSPTKFVDTRGVPEGRQHWADLVLHHWLEQQLRRPPDLQEVPKQPLVLQGLQQSGMMRNLCGAT